MQKYIRATEWVEINKDEGVPKGAVLSASDFNMFDYDMTKFELIECEPKDLELNFGVWRVRRDRTAKVIPWECLIGEEEIKMNKEEIMRLYREAKSEWLGRIGKFCSEETLQIATAAIGSFEPAFEKILEKGIDK